MLTPNDPTYERESIDSDPVWRLAFLMSEIDNDRAPIGWGRYISLARSLLLKFEMIPKNTD